LQPAKQRHACASHGRRIFSGASVAPTVREIGGADCAAQADSDSARSIAEEAHAREFAPQNAADAASADSSNATQTIARLYACRRTKAMSTAMYLERAPRPA
jgi:hypothetical protein